MNIKNLFNSKKNAKSTDESSAPVNWLGFTGKPGTIGSHTIGYPVTKETLEKINSYADAIGYPVTRESLKKLKARDLLTDATGRPDNAENPENSSYKSQLYKPLKVIKLYII